MTFVSAATIAAAPAPLTPAPSPAPRINGAGVVGARPSRPFIHRIPATGERPMVFGADSLPDGLALDPTSGRITGTTPANRGDYRIQLHATNRHGRATRELRLMVGDALALTPPMGWNSWNAFAGTVTAEKIRASAEALVRSGLADHGFAYVNIDDFWQRTPDHKEVYRAVRAVGNEPREYWLKGWPALHNDPTLAGPARDAEGRILPNRRFEDMRGLAEFIHGLGLKAGLYSSPGPATCGGVAGSLAHEELDARTYAEWGFDFLKYDQCSYTQLLPAAISNLRVSHVKPYAVMGAALAAQPRDIVYSLCQYGVQDVVEWGAAVGGQLWRTTGDITDTWDSVSTIGFGQAGLERFSAPGRWNDPDMLVVGQLGWGEKLRASRLTPDEQYAHVSLWCLLSAPLLLGCDLTQLDSFTLGLLTNDEVLSVNQDALGRQAARLAQNGGLEVWVKPLEDGSHAVGLFNRGSQPATNTVRFAALGRSGAQRVRDLWRQRDLGVFRESFSAEVPEHGVVLVRLSTDSAVRLD